MNTIHVAAEKHAALISCDVNASWPWNIAVSGFQMHVMDQANLIFSFNQCNLSLYFVGSAVSRFQNNVRAILKIPHHQGLTFENSRKAPMHWLSWFVRRCEPLYNGFPGQFLVNVMCSTFVRQMFWVLPHQYVLQVRIENPKS